ncbi:MAG: DUF4129 domain-containing protein [Gaiellaceae bacterium]
MAGDRAPEIAPRRRVGLLALSVLALLGVVALASRGHSPTGTGESREVRGIILFEYVALFLGFMALIVVPLVAYTVWTGRRDVQLRDRGNWMVRLLVGMALISVIFASVATYRLIRGGDSGIAPRSGMATNTGQGTGVDGARGDFDWAPVIVMSSIFLGGGAIAAFLLFRTGTRRPPSAARIAEELSNVLDETLDDLRAERDARRAVIGAYARMERALAWFGLPRHPFEAPLEYLARVLVEHDASAESVSRLTQLFERAKFSQHEIGPDAKEDAIEALVAVRDELRSHR